MWARLIKLIIQLLKNIPKFIARGVLRQIGIKRGFIKFGLTLFKGKGLQKAIMSAIRTTMTTKIKGLNTMLRFIDASKGKYGMTLRSWLWDSAKKWIANKLVPIEIRKIYYAFTKNDKDYDKFLKSLEDDIMKEVKDSKKPRAKVRKEIKKQVDQLAKKKQQVIHNEIIKALKSKEQGEQAMGLMMLGDVMIKEKDRADIIDKVNDGIMYHTLNSPQDSNFSGDEMEHMYFLKEKVSVLSIRQGYYSNNMGVLTSPLGALNSHNQQYWLRKKGKIKMYHNDLSKTYMGYLTYHNVSFVKMVDWLCSSDFGKEIFNKDLANEATRL